MTTQNWPDPKRPGVPPNPERDGLYAMRLDEKFIVRYWSAARQHYSLVPEWKKGISPADASVFTFCGEILTPTQINEMLAAERERCADIADAKRDAVWDGKIGSLAKDKLRTGYAQAAITIADAIRNLGAAP